MRQTISLLTLPVADLAVSRRFYEDGLGWRPAFANDQIAFYQMNGMVFGLFLRDAFAEELPGVGQAGSAAVAHNEPSREAVDAAIATAVAAGATILKPATATDWGGYSGYFADPDGHAWEVAHNPFWTITEDGRTIIGG